MHFSSIMCPIVPHHRCLSHPPNNVVQNRQNGIERTNYLNKNNTTTQKTTTRKHQQGDAATFSAANSPPNHPIQLCPIPNPPQQQPEQLREQQGSNPPPRCLAIQPILQAATPTTLPAANKP